MAETVSEQIKSIKYSLENAENSFRQNNDVRGELDLMLAEAEMKHLREKRGTKSIWNRQKLAFVIAMMLALTGYVGWWYGGYGSAEKAAEQKLSTNTKANVSINKTLPTSGVSREKTEIASVDGNANQEERLFIPKEEMYQMVRAGRRVLRNID